MPQSRGNKSNGNPNFYRLDGAIATADDNKQRGNVFILIMLGVFLFGALMYSFTKSGNQGAGNLTKQQAKIAAQEILNYVRLVEGAVDRVRRNGCSESEISFENSVVSAYLNPNSPTNKSCHIFDDEGGKLSWSNPPLAFHFDDPAFFFGKYYFISAQWIGHGCDDPNDKCVDLIMALSNLDKTTCSEINKNFNLSSSSIPTEVNSGGNRFQGNFTYISAHIFSDEAGSTIIAGKNGACINTDNVSYAFIYPLLAR